MKCYVSDGAWSLQSWIHRKKHEGRSKTGYEKPLGVENKKKIIEMNMNMTTIHYIIVNLSIK